MHPGAAGGTLDPDLRVIPLMAGHKLSAAHETYVSLKTVIRFSVPVRGFRAAFRTLDKVFAGILHYSLECLS